MSHAPTPRADEKTPAGGPQWLGLGGLLIVSTIVLFLGFYRDQWEVVREKKFKEFQTDSESLVIARMVKSRQSGVFSENGLLGWGDADPLNLNASDYTHQYDTYLSGQIFQTYSLYKSVSGFQGMAFSLLDRLSPSTPAINVRNFRALEALLLALTMSLFIAWILLEFGWISALFVLATTTVSQWITLYGHNLFYFIWASFLPLGLVSFYLAREVRTGRTSNTRLAWLGFGAILFKCMMNGYDFIIPALWMPAAPVLYYGLRERWSRFKLLTRLSFLCAGLVAALVTSLLILSAQLTVSQGSLGGGIASVLSTFSRRTYADPNAFPLYAESLEANPWSVLWTYVSEDTAIEVLGLSFLDLIVFFAMVTGIYLIVAFFAKATLPDRDKALALIGTTWLSMLSPVSWFVIFKGQAYVHTHTNYLAWHMPFMLFGYALCAYLLRSLVLLLTRRNSAARPGP